MIRRLAGLALLWAGAAAGTYTYDWTDYWWYTGTLSGRWNQNGTAQFTNSTYAPYPTYGAHALTFTDVNGSLISIPAMSGANPNDYEVLSTLALRGGGADYIHFLRANSTAVEVGSGSYISAEIILPWSFQSTGAATLNINQCVNGTITQLASTSITASDGMTFRTVIFGTNLWVFVNGVRVLAQTVPLSMGNPGIGGWDQPSGSGFLITQLGPHDTIVPGQISHTVPTSVFPTSASLKWAAAADDANGVGVFEYYISRNGSQIGSSPSGEFGDSTVQPSTTYMYSIQAVDYHGNVGAGTAVSVTTPPANAVDPRRVGLFNTGAYWGGGGEQIDMLSGNLNFSIPLLAA